MKTLEAKLNALNELVAEFRYPEAHDQFYHAELVKHENEDAPTVGLESHRKEMVQFMDSISNQKAVLLNTIVSDNLTISEWHYTFDHVQWGHRDFREVSVQRWRDGKVVHERHHYATN